jgi:hypothetical protein
MISEEYIRKEANLQVVMKVIEADEVRGVPKDYSEHGDYHLRISGVIIPTKVIYLRMKAVECGCLVINVPVMEWRV